jgi:hypothetical protein
MIVAQHAKIKAARESGVLKDLSPTGYFLLCYHIKNEAEPLDAEGAAYVWENMGMFFTEEEIDDILEHERQYIERHPEGFAA